MDSESYSHQSKGNKVLKLSGHQSRDHSVWSVAITLHKYRINIYFEFLDSEQSVIFIGIIVGLSFVAVLLASISLILIKKSKNKKSHLTHFEKSNSFQANIYTQNTFCKVRNDFYLNPHWGLNHIRPHAERLRAQNEPNPNQNFEKWSKQKNEIVSFRIRITKEAYTKATIARQFTQHLSLSRRERTMHANRTRSTV